MVTTEKMMEYVLCQKLLQTSYLESTLDSFNQMCCYVGSTKLKISD